MQIQFDIQEQSNKPIFWKNKLLEMNKFILAKFILMCAVNNKVSKNPLNILLAWKSSYVLIKISLKLF